MEFIRAILEKAVVKDGKLDVEAAMEQINEEFPKHAVPKEDYNGKMKEFTPNLKLTVESCIMQAK